MKSYCQCCRVVVVRRKMCFVCAVGEHISDVVETSWFRKIATMPDLPEKDAKLPEARIRRRR